MKYLAESTRDIKRRIRGISNTKQITKAMELVSSAKLRRAREKLEKTRPYFNTVLESIQEVLSSTGNIRHPFLEHREVKRSLYIVITADGGLAGGYNSNIIRLVENKIKDKKDKVDLIVIGSKGKDYFNNRGYNVIGEFINITEEPKFSDAVKIGKLAMEHYENKGVDEVVLAYTEFITTLSQDTKAIKLLPNKDVNEDKKEKTSVIDYEPSAEEVLDYLIPKYIESTVYGALIESSCSEQGSRMTAMKSATENAEEMIDELTLSYNRARQAAITSEISEIVAGAEALK
ncbi:ATP synthase F1 subunit gamma [Anaerosalibacter massiliensis]|uniref:ATP synthase gamma chain n=1 Tax=Anaerosalibacter massiliensis TaxID=1347392 RepID=A0A9X2MJB5_9FIRM|nr:ATP synthase F1 subunit gamma [Anaerosalibacter massiliensis]